MRLLGIDLKVKELLLNQLEKAIEKTEKSDFDGMMGLATRLMILPEMYPSEWDEEFCLASFVIGGIGSSTDTEFKKLASDKKTQLLKDYSSLLKAFGDAIEKEDIKMENNVLKSMVARFYKEFGV